MGNRTSELRIPSLAILAVALGAPAVVPVRTCVSVLAAAVVELSVVERQGQARRGEPVTFAVPFPKGQLRSAEQVRLLRDGKEVPAQFRATGLWRPDVSIRTASGDTVRTFFPSRSA